MPMVGGAMAAVMSRARPSATPSTTTENAPASAVAFASAMILARLSSSRPLALKPPSTSTAWGRKPT